MLRDDFNLFDANVKKRLQNRLKPHDTKSVSCGFINTTDHPVLAADNPQCSEYKNNFKNNYLGKTAKKMVNNPATHNCRNCRVDQYAEFSGYIHNKNTPFILLILYVYSLIKNLKFLTILMVPSKVKITVSDAPQGRW